MDITIKVTPDGVELDVNNVDGPACATIINNLINDLKNRGIDVKIEEDRPKPEYYNLAEDINTI